MALLAFGIDSFVELGSGLILVWRRRADQQAGDDHGRHDLDTRALRLVGLSLFLLAAYVAADATHALVRSERPEPTFVGMARTAVSMGLMLWLGRAKRRAAAALESRGAGGRRLPDHGLLVAVARHAGRHRPERGPRLVVGRPRRGAGHDALARARRPRGLARRQLHVRLSTDVRKAWHSDTGVALGINAPDIGEVIQTLVTFGLYGIRARSVVPS